MTKEELININGIREDLYQAMQIGDITLSSKDSQKLVDFMNYQDKEIERLNNKHNKALYIDYNDVIRILNIDDLYEQVKKQKEVINNAIEYIEKHTYHDTPKKLQNGIYEREELIIKK